MLRKYLARFSNPSREGISNITETNERRVRIHSRNVRVMFQKALLTCSVQVVDILFPSGYKISGNLFESLPAAKYNKTQDMLGF